MASPISPAKDFNSDSMELDYQKYLVKVVMVVGLPVLAFFSIYDFFAFMLVIMTSFFFERLRKNDNVVRIASIAEGITDRKQAEVALRESEERFRELAELMAETIFEMDLDGRPTFVNRNDYDFFAYSPQDFERGLNSFDMLAPEDHERAMENVMKIKSGAQLTRQLLGYARKGKYNAKALNLNQIN